MPGHSGGSATRVARGVSLGRASIACRQGHSGASAQVGGLTRSAGSREERERGAGHPLLVGACASGLPRVDAKPAGRVLSLTPV